MGKIIYAMSVSLDGFVSSANGDLSWANPDAELHRYFNEQEQSLDTFIYGRRMYDDMTAYWPTADQNPSAPQPEIEYTRIWKAKPKIVFSHTLTEAGWNARLVKGDVAEQMRQLKARPGVSMSVSGPNLAGQFLQLGLIDECRLYVYPVILGGGKAMFPNLDKPVKLKLVETRLFESGVMLLRYAVGG